MSNTDRQRLPSDRLWTIQEVAYFLRVPVATLYYWRTRGEGPECCRVGRHLRYRADRVWAWLDQRTASD
jgi:predicted DNA-binding transcriptional regulator AlpA